MEFQCFVEEQRDLNKEVKVVTAYQPKINKSKRIGELPVVVDTATFTPSFTYFVQTKPLPVGFSPAAIPAARIVGEPLKPINGHSLTLGGGNYSTLFGDYRFNNQRSKVGDFGIHLRHYSTNGKLELENGDKEKPDWLEQLAEVYGSVYLDEGKISGRVFYENKGSNYFGFPKEGDVDQTWFDLYPYEKQKLQKFGFSADFQSAFQDEERLNFGAGINYEHFSDDLEVKENDLELAAQVKIRRGDGVWSLASNFDYFGTEGLWHWTDQKKVNERNTLVWKLQPQYLLQTGNLSLQLGVKTHISMGDDSEAKIYPDVSIDYEAVDGILSLFAGIDGDLQMNRYKNIAFENPYVFSGLTVAPSNQKYRLFGGLKGSLSSNSSFKVSAEYSGIDNQYFYLKSSQSINPEDMMLSVPTYSNKFGVVYDDITLLRLAAEVNIGWTDKLELNSVIRYNHYTMDKEAEAWHQPEFEMNVNALYHFSKQISFQAGVNLLGERPVLYQNEKRNLDAVYDFNIGANYQLNKNFTAFVKVNNLFADKYYQWDGYPSQGLNALLGIKVIF